MHCIEHRQFSTAVIGSCCHSGTMSGEQSSDNSQDRSTRHARGCSEDTPGDLFRVWLWLHLAPRLLHRLSVKAPALSRSYGKVQASEHRESQSTAQLIAAQSWSLLFTKAIYHDRRVARLKCRLVTSLTCISQELQANLIQQMRSQMGGDT